MSSSGNSPGFEPSPANHWTLPSPPTDICSTKWPLRSKRRPEPRDCQHGCGRCPDFRAHHPCSGQLQEGIGGVRAAKAAGSARSRSIACCCAASTKTRLRASPDFSRRRRHRPFYRVHAAGRRPPLDAGDRGASARDRLRRISSECRCVPARPREPSETARRYTFDDGVGEIGIIAPVRQPSAERAAASGSRPTARSAPACSPR